MNRQCRAIRIERTRKWRRWSGGLTPTFDSISIINAIDKNADSKMLYGEQVLNFMFLEPPLIKIAQGEENRGGAISGSLNFEAATV